MFPLIRPSGGDAELWRADKLLVSVSRFAGGLRVRGCTSLHGIRAKREDIGPQSVQHL